MSHSRKRFRYSKFVLPLHSSIISFVAWTTSTRSRRRRRTSAGFSGLGNSKTCLPSPITITPSPLVWVSCILPPLETSLPATLGQGILEKRARLCRRVGEQVAVAPARAHDGEKQV